VINLFLGVVLLLFSSSSTELPAIFGIPRSDSSFYPAIALLVEAFRKPGAVGLGLGGTVAINLSGGIVLVCWLVSGGLGLPTKGVVILWALAVVLVLISSAELLAHWLTD